MTLTDDEVIWLREAWHSPGGHILRNLLSEQAREPQDELYEIMTRKPDSLTGKSAIAKANRSKALHDFRQFVDDIAAPSQPIKSRAEETEGSRQG